ncbi:MAG: aminomethyl-transferring glycine dehydrogenase subunit GcvPA [Alphaproteobacteria bacterium]|jgi:glycine dehydrogenase subunit 1|nr:aminomethyl-transferring glycine dehydrogenase subunit GcvPA [Alphaproteobacteria bacterium]
MRYLPLTEADRSTMLATIGAGSIDELYCDVPPGARLDGPVDLPHHAGELEVERALAGLAARNVPAGSVPSFLGAGAYRHHIPATVDHLIQRGEFLTSYTPYQPEVSQGTLHYLFEFQTQVALLTGMDVANASLYDGATACAEAVMMANRVTRRKKAVLSGGLHPHYAETTATLARYTGFDLVRPDPDPTGTEDLVAQIDDETSCVVVQTPDLFGNVRELSRLAEACHARKALLIAVVTEVVSLGLLTPPGDMGADIVAAEGQSIGNTLNFGGPHVGLFATRDKYIRNMPGRLCGETVDTEGRRGFVLTLSTREQHIRREKATSNICTNSGLCALGFTIHLSLLGELGLMRLAETNHARAIRLADRLAAVPGVAVLNDGFFNEITVRLPQAAGPLVDRLADRGILAGVPVSRLYPDRPDLADLLLCTATETNTDDDIEALATALHEEVR